MNTMARFASVRHQGLRMQASWMSLFHVSGPSDHFKGFIFLVDLELCSLGLVRWRGVASTLQFLVLIVVCLLVHACWHAPLVVVNEAKLAIVFTYFFSLLFFSFLSFFLHLLLFTPFGDTQEANFF